jgi:hypothetical protein
MSYSLGGRKRKRSPVQGLRAAVEGERRNNARLSWADAELAGVSRLQMTNVGVQSRFDPRFPPRDGKRGQEGNS